MREVPKHPAPAIVAAIRLGRDRHGVAGVNIGRLADARTGAGRRVIDAGPGRLRSR